MLVVNQFGAAIRSRKGGTSPFAVLPGSAQQAISHPDVKNRMVTVRDDINQKLLLCATIEIVRDFSTHSTSLRARLSVEMTDVDSLKLHDDSQAVATL